MTSANLVVIGGGIVGLATAYNFLQAYPQKTLTLLEKEEKLATHQTGHNSGVLHSGIYYKPGSLKSATCRSGKKAMEEFCEREGIPYRICGKVIVAVDESEAARLAALNERGRENGIDCKVIDRSRLTELEPHAGGVKAIHVPETGIVDFTQVCSHLAARIREKGGDIITRAEVTAMREGSNEVMIQSAAGDYTAKYVINCAGLYSDRVASFVTPSSEVKIVPFRGEYFELRPEAQHLCSALIYPVPDLNFPFLGVHFTRRINGSVECGPNAVLAFAREGYRKSDVRLSELLEAVTYTGFLRLARKYWRTGSGEMWRSYSKSAFVKALQRLMPEISAHQLDPAPAGVRAQAVTRDGSLLDDFAFQETTRVVNVINAPSPAATASLRIGGIIVEKLARRF